MCYNGANLPLILLFCWFVSLVHPVASGVPVCIALIVFISSKTSLNDILDTAFAHFDNNTSFVTVVVIAPGVVIDCGHCIVLS